MPWDPEQYLACADERALPFHHLVAAVAHLRPARVLDVGCGPGALTATLLERWPGAEIHGIDSSAEMIALAERRAVTDRLTFELADVMELSAGPPVDLVLSNACFHWIEDHHRLLCHLESFMKPNATLAFQVPANHDQPSPHESLVHRDGSHQSATSAARILASDYPLNEVLPIRRFNGSARSQSRF